VVKKDLSQASFQVFSTRRCAVLHLFRIFNKTGWPREAHAPLQQFFKGLKRTLVSQSATSGAVKVQEGKEALQFTLYRYLNTSLLQSVERDAVFSHCYNVLSWNLMCRAGNTATIKYKHLKWMEDALGVYFAQMKNDQEGDRPKDARHVYANPIYPEVCPILALGLYFLIFGFDPAGRSLFSGTSQYNRYLKQLHRLLEAESEELSDKGLKPSDLGTHSTRKGAASYASSGTTSCPPIMAITLRAGWTMSKVESAYYRFEGAGDQHVGRTVAGLPSGKADFAILPPYFRQRTDRIKQIIQNCFPNAPDPGTLSPEVLEFCLASVVYHANTLRQLNARHPVFQTALFTEPNLMSELLPQVICRQAQPSDRIQPTGIPLIVSILGDLENLKAAHSQLKQQLTDQSQTIIDGVTSRVVSILEERAIGAGTVTTAGLDTKIQSLQDWLEQKLAFVHAAREEPQPERPPQVMLRAPPEFKVPKVSPQQAWQQYWLGNHEKGYPPLRQWKARDLPTKTAKNRFGEYRSLMRTMEQKLKEDMGAAWKEPTTLEEVNQLYSQACHAIAVPELTAKNRRRRVNELSWATVKKLRRNV